jgi:hypothetical protein
VLMRRVGSKSDSVTIDTVIVAGEESDCCSVLYYPSPLPGTKVKLFCWQDSLKNNLCLWGVGEESNLPEEKKLPSGNTV